jgi:hypothetical protein
VFAFRLLVPGYPSARWRECRSRDGAAVVSRSPFRRTRGGRPSPEAARASATDVKAPRKRRRRDYNGDDARDEIVRRDWQASFFETALWWLATSDRQSHHSPGRYAPVLGTGTTGAGVERRGLLSAPRANSQSRPSRQSAAAVPPAESRPGLVECLVATCDISEIASRYRFRVNVTIWYSVEGDLVDSVLSCRWVNTVLGIQKHGLKL